MTLQEYVAQLTSPEFSGFCARQAQLPHEQVEKRLNAYAGEVAVGVDLLEGVLRPGQRVLEVGSGLGLLSIWLARQGASVVMLEPGAGGFSDNRRLLEPALEWFDVQPTVLAIPAECLDPAVHGTFDAIFSVNVLEHVPALEHALSAMLAVLDADGIMRHTCPNYAVPYEPHYELPLVPFAPRLTARLVPRLADQELWQSLNFITHRRIARFCRANGLDCRFDSGLLARALDRMEHDDAFRSRRSPTVRWAQRAMQRTGLISALRHLPPGWTTPMTFTCRRHAAAPAPQSH